MMERDLQMKSEEYEVKLQSLEDSHRHSMLDMRNLLNQQQRMSAKWVVPCPSAKLNFWHWRLNCNLAYWMHVNEDIYSQTIHEGLFTYSSYCSWQYYQDSSNMNAERFFLD